MINLRSLISLTVLCLLNPIISGMKDSEREEMRKRLLEKYGNTEQNIFNKKRKINLEEQPINQNNNIQQNAIQRVVAKQNPQKIQPEDRVMISGYGSEITLELPYCIACESETLFNLIEDTGIENPIPLNNIRYNHLEKCIIPALKTLDIIKKYYQQIYNRPATLQEIKKDLILFLENNAGFPH